ncbi:hypothetical protein ASG37_16840 [Sphingomonas sp. Leaf407]|uniref:hypothetical protein n=1 Tax=unclassified Sphingomonas TaxID=196159 RepID=UPI0006FBDB24|nr:MULTISPECIES: hypothetical protein [unclassified Sphingomonas]KQN39858.1 hypothetical protein ASE97_16830 [Sphingomonas sp. Leaf42]KQT23644.1 hypothetical protein ASG37_16840 [Sphingomonas sp. Leaf407]
MAVPRYRYTSDALPLMAGTIRIERGDAGCAVGSVSKVATILGVPLFGLEAGGLAQAATRTADRLVLLSGAVCHATRVDDAF